MNFLKTKNNQVPVEDFLDKLNPEDARRLTWMLRFIEQSKEGILPDQFVFDGLEDSLSEFRISTSAGNAWILAISGEKGWGLAAAGLAKRSRKAPEKESRKVVKNLEELHRGIRLLPVSDIEQYITRRKQKEDAFKANFESAYQYFKMGALLRQIRDELGSNQQEMADELGESASMISKAENHTQSVDTEVVVRYLDLLKRLWKDKK